MDDKPQEQTSEEWVHVGKYPTLEQANDHGLVILAMGEACRVEKSPTPGEFDLQAEVVPAEKISAELDAYSKEIIDAVKTPVPGREWVRHPAGWPICGIWMLVLMAVFYWQGLDETLVERAASSSVGIFGRGEWWRPFTALFLHADLSHLTGNLLGGVLFGTLLARLIGPLRGWALILASGTLANLINARMNFPDRFLSIGASSAVFAALGILSGLGVSETLRDRVRLPWVRITAPVVAGVVLLGWLGSGSGSTHTDVMGHVFGFGSGLVAGVVTEALMEHSETSPT